VLPKPNRLTRGADYRFVVRGGKRCVGAHTVTYVVASGDRRAPRFGFIVSKQVGGAVVRNTVRRRLKAVCAEALVGVADGADVVIRALPGAATAPFGDLRAEVRSCLQRRAAA
jgi:ribonuclease P protein component